MEHIVKTYILLLFSLLVSSIGYAQEENDIIYIQEGKWGVILCGERGYAWLDNKGDTIFGFGKLQEISADDDFNLVLAEKSLVVKRQDKVGVVMKDGEQLIPASMIRFLHGGNMGISAHYVVKDKKWGID